MKHFQETHHLRFGLSDFIGGSPRGIKDLIDLVSQLPVTPTQVILSQIQVYFSNIDADEFEEKMRLNNLGPSAIQKILNFTKERGTRVSVFTIMPITLVQETFRQFHSEITKPDLQIKEILNKITEAILIANDICNSVIIPPENAPIDKDAYATFALRESLFNQIDQFRYSIGRSYLIYEELKVRCREEYPEDFFDIDLFFNAHFGISLLDYFYSIFLLYSYWGEQTFENWDPKYTILSLQNLLKDQDLKKEVLASVSRFAQPWHSKPTLSSAITDEELRSFMYELFELRKFPLLEVAEGYLCGNLRFITRKYWEGPYYEIIDSKIEEKEKKQFFRYLGRTTEMYVQGLLKYSFGGNFKKIKSSKGIPISDAVVSLNPKWNLIFEVKAKRPTRDMISGNQTPNTLKSVSAMLFEGLKQLDDRIQNLIEDGHKGRITPILVTGGFFPINAFLWDHYFQEIKSLKMFLNPCVDWPQLMDLESVEVFSALKSQTPIANMLREKLNDDWKKESIKTFMYLHYIPKTNKTEPFHPLMAKIYKDKNAEMINLLFPKNRYGLKQDQSWKKEFEI